MRVIRQTSFGPGAQMDGGRRRTLQIEELLVRRGADIFDVTFESCAVPWLRKYARGLAFARALGFPSVWQRRALAWCGHQIHAFDALLRQHADTRWFLWEKTGDFAAAFAAKALGWRVVATPHNLESLVPGQRCPVTRAVLPESLAHEIAALRMADAVFCISREEHWLLRGHGVPAEYLPYYPPLAIEQRCLAIRHRRRKAPENRFVLLGTAHNVPTREGMLQLLEVVEAALASAGAELVVAGFGTEALASRAPVGIRVLGALSNEQLDELLAEVRGILMYQDRGSGALTKIPEMLVAGVPVLGNGIACRSALEHDGVHCFEDMASLAGLMRGTLAMPGIPTRPVEAERRFCELFEGRDNGNRTMRLRGVLEDRFTGSL